MMSYRTTAQQHLTLIIIFALTTGGLTGCKKKEQSPPTMEQLKEEAKKEINEENIEEEFQKLEKEIEEETTST